MDVEQFKDDVRSGRIDGDRLVELVLMLLGQLQQAREQLQQARERNDELEKELGRRTPKPGR